MRSTDPARLHRRPRRHERVASALTSTPDEAERHALPARGAAAWCWRRHAEPHGVRRSAARTEPVLAAGAATTSRRCAALGPALAIGGAGDRPAREGAVGRRTSSACRVDRCRRRLLVNDRGRRPRAIAALSAVTSAGGLAARRRRAPPRPARRGRSPAAGDDAGDAESCSDVGSSPSRTTPRSTEPTGWIVSVTDVSAAGSRGSETAISSQPSTCEVSASVSSQPWAGQVGTRSASPITSPATTAATAATAVASNSGPAGRRRSAPAWRSTRMKPA